MILEAVQPLRGWINISVRPRNPGPCDKNCRWRRRSIVSLDFLRDVEAARRGCKY